MRELIRISAVLMLTVLLAAISATASDFTLGIFGNANMDDKIDEADKYIQFYENYENYFKGKTAGLSSSINETREKILNRPELNAPPINAVTPGISGHLLYRCQLQRI